MLSLPALHVCVQHKFQKGLALIAADSVLLAFATTSSSLCCKCLLILQLISADVPASLYQWWIYPTDYARKFIRLCTPLSDRSCLGQNEYGQEFGKADATAEERAKKEQ